MHRLPFATPYLGVTESVQVKAIVIAVQQIDMVREVVQPPISWTVSMQAPDPMSSAPARLRGVVVGPGLAGAAVAKAGHDLLAVVPGHELCDDVLSVGKVLEPMQVDAVLLERAHETSSHAVASLPSVPKPIFYSDRAEFGVKGRLPSMRTEVGRSVRA